MAMLELRGIGKHFGDVRALDGVDFFIPEGSVFGLLGPNGAGKTTLIRIVTGILGPDTGTVSWNDRPLRPEDTSRIGYMPEERGLYRKMRVGEQLLYLARLKGLNDVTARKRIDAWLNRFDMIEFLERRIEDLSKGQQQKIQFVSTVLHDPGLLILDEPFSGLDPINTSRLKDEIRDLRRRGTTIIFSTHRMEQIEEICDEIVLLNEGKVVLEGRLDAIRDRFKKHVFSIGVRGETGSLTHPGFEVIEQEDEHMVVRLRNGMASNDLLALLIERGVEIVSFREILPSINEIFIQLVGVPPSRRRSLAGAKLPADA